jgi:branched-chain amino acid transport system substrate-binding protein
MTRHRKILGLLVVGTLTLAACSGGDDTAAPETTEAAASETTAAPDAGGDEGDSTDTTAAPAEECSEPIVIGVPMEITGAVEPYTTPTIKGIELAIEQANAAGGVLGCQIEIVKEDFASDRARFPAAIRKLAGEGVDAMIGPIASTSLAVGASVAGEEEIVMVAPTSVERFPEGTLNQWIYRVAPVNAIALPSMLKQIQDATGFTKLAVFYDPANNASVNDVTLLEQLDPGDDTWELVIKETAEQGATDFSTQISNIADSGADAIWMAHLVEENGSFMIQARERGIEASFVGGVTFTNKQTFEIAGSAAEGAVTYVPFLASVEDPIVQDFAAAFEAKYGETPDVFGAQGYTGALAVLEGLRLAGSTDPEALRAAMSTMSFDSPIGPIVYENRSDNATPTLTLVRNEGGTFVPVS